MHRASLDSGASEQGWDPGTPLGPRRGTGKGSWGCGRVTSEARMKSQETLASKGPRAMSEDTLNGQALGWAWGEEGRDGGGTGQGSRGSCWTRARSYMDTLAGAWPGWGARGLQGSQLQGRSRSASALGGRGLAVVGQGWGSLLGSGCPSRPSLRCPGLWGMSYLSPPHKLPPKQQLHTAARLLSLVSGCSA